MPSSVVFKTIIIRHPFRKLIICTLLLFKGQCFRMLLHLVVIAIQTATVMESVFFKTNYHCIKC